MRIGIKDCFYTMDAIVEYWDESGGYIRKNQKEKMNKRKLIRLFQQVIFNLGIDKSLYMSESVHGKCGVFIFSSPNTPDRMKALIELYDNTDGFADIYSDIERELQDILEDLLPIARTMDDINILLRNRKNREKECDSDNKIKLSNKTDKKNKEVWDVHHKYCERKQKVTKAIYSYKSKNITGYFNDQIFVRLDIDEYTSKGKNTKFYQIEFETIRDWNNKWKKIISDVKDKCQEINLIGFEGYANIIISREYNQIRKQYNLEKRVNKLKKKDVKGSNDCSRECGELVSEINCSINELDKSIKERALKKDISIVKDIIRNDAFDELKDIHKRLEKRLGRNSQVVIQQNLEKDELQCCEDGAKRRKTILDSPKLTADQINMILNNDL